MNQRNLNRFLRELTPEIRAYLFPGMAFGETYLAEPPIPDGALHEPSAMYDMMPEASFEADRESAAIPMQRREHKPLLRKRILVSRQSAVDAPAAEPDTEALDPRTEEILSEIRRLQEKYGVSIEELEILLGYTVKLSPLRIGRSGKIILADYDGAEVKMPNISKALYFLYLRHPEGLRYKDIADHKDELLHLYSGITGRDDPAEIEKSIDLLADPFGNALNVNASRIKTAFRNVVSDRIARFYYLSGGAGELKKVPLDRDLVIWEY